MVDELPPEPTRRVAPAALGAWILTSTTASVILAVVAAGGLPVLAEVDGLPGWVIPVLVVAVVLTCAGNAVVVPVLRYRTIRYEIRPEEIDLMDGVVVRARTIVPMARVQHVETERGLLENLFGVATLSIYTAAGGHEIPGLRDSVAAQLRTEIAQAARVPDDV